MIEILKNIFSDVNFNINLTMHTLVLFTFLSIFFVFYISKLSKHAFDDEISHLIEESLGDKIKKFKNTDSNINKELSNLIKESLGDKLIKDLKQVQSNFSTDKLEKEWDKPDKPSEMHNKGLFNTLFFVNVLLWIGLIVVICILNMNPNSTLNIKDIVIENAVIFTFIAIVEFLFFTTIALKFIPVAPSFISQEFLNQVKTLLKINKSI